MQLNALCYENVLQSPCVAVLLVLLESSPGRPVRLPGAQVVSVPVPGRPWHTTKSTNDKYQAARSHYSSPRSRSFARTRIPLLRWVMRSWHFTTLCAFSLTKHLRNSHLHERGKTQETMGLNTKFTSSTVWFRLKSNHNQQLSKRFSNYV